MFRTQGMRHRHRAHGGHHMLGDVSTVRPVAQIFREDGFPSVRRDAAGPDRDPGHSDLHRWRQHRPQAVSARLSHSSYTRLQRATLVPSLRKRCRPQPATTRRPAMSDRDDLPRTVLPIPDRPRAGLITYDAKDPETAFPPIRQLRPPKGAPNVLVILLDDAGFGSSSAFGGPCRTPVFERLAQGGLKFNRFHTTALCSPSRAAMLTGRNHHSVGMGGITEIATSAPGYN